MIGQHCCLCSSSCLHVGGPYYCQMHMIERYGQRPQQQSMGTSNQDWQTHQKLDSILSFLQIILTKLDQK